MKLEPELLHNIHGGEADLQRAILALAIVLALVTLLVAVAEARRAPSAAAGWLSGVALVAIIVMAVLVGTITAGHTAEVCVASQYGVGDRYHGRRTASRRIFNTYARDPTLLALRARSVSCGSSGWIEARTACTRKSTEIVSCGIDVVLALGIVSL